jgi:hypothetical protein
MRSDHLFGRATRREPRPLPPEPPEQPAEAAQSAPAETKAKEEARAA